MLGSKTVTLEPNAGPAGRLPGAAEAGVVPVSELTVTTVRPMANIRPNCRRTVRPARVVMLRGPSVTVRNKLEHSRQ
ncbi:hypothetical protein Ari01nite_81460 [Paractinoplanes rishiriensis]|uniref:Uncharacterized protein n=1 Tax=Paractinoplanes rishiriensis TaxID=1050105 RepID=A0A919K4D1_9ACTN|nr:hypothetical protein Ari01nite_81460 [Actinoplanes rishiriensis]